MPRYLYRQDGHTDNGRNDCPQVNYIRKLVSRYQKVTPRKVHSLLATWKICKQKNRFTRLFVREPATIQNSTSIDGRPAVVGDPTEGALLVVAAKGSIMRKGTETEMPAISCIASYNQNPLSSAA